MFYLFERIEMSEIEMELEFDILFDIFYLIIPMKFIRLIPLFYKLYIYLFC